MEDQRLRWRRVRLPFQRLRWWRCRIPFRAPFATARDQLEERQSVLVALEASDGCVGWGEIAPLPGFGRRMGNTLGCLEMAAERLVKAPASDVFFATVVSNLDLLFPGAATSASVAVHCGLEMALLDLVGQTAGASIARLLAEEPATTIPVNATVGAMETARAVELAAAAAAAGYRAVKLKVGMLPDAGAEAARVAAVRAALGPAVRLRLDANAGWSVAEAVAVLRACAPFAIDYVEQPVAAHDLDGLATVRRQAGVPLAADEAVTGVDAVERLLALEAVAVLVLKPMALGGALATWELAALARDRGVDVVITSMLEAGVGIAAAAQLAAALPPPLRPCGLATAALLESDLLTAPLPIDGGLLHLPAGQGLGVRVDEAALRRYTVSEGCWERRP